MRGSSFLMQRFFSGYFQGRFVFLFVDRRHSGFHMLFLIRGVSSYGGLYI